MGALGREPVGGQVGSRGRGQRRRQRVVVSQIHLPKDVDTIYHAEDNREFNLLDFSHLESR